MPSTYTILGATGNCGQALLGLLLERQDVNIKVYCRNKEKLLRLVPKIFDFQNVEIYTGHIQDIDLLAKAMYGSAAVFLAASTNDNIPGCHISQDLVGAVIKALEQIKSADQTTHMPRLALLSSASIDPWLSRNTPWITAIIGRSAYHVYRDLELAEALLRQHEQWVSCVYIKPGGLSIDIQRGHRLSLDFEDEAFVSYLDIAAGMLEAVDDADGQWNGKNVCVLNANGRAKFPAGTPRCIFFGLLRFYFPFLHAYLPSGTGPA